MAKGSGRSLLLAGLAAGAYAYLQNPENRGKFNVAFKNLRTKTTSFLATQKLGRTQMTKAGHSDPNDPDDNRMVEEGSMTSVQYYNEGMQEKKSEFGSLDAFPKSQKKILPENNESLQASNNQSPAKQENTARETSDYVLNESNVNTIEMKY
ncbi:hypothetical protein [Paenisporosarcina antarctica]|uniref:YtxH domain-containing protein n=1 Tax=Paenisporosarcina antarctica TaxID=417367 RepID=A0A4P6ZXX5_9BACL|nr:hypothetical protein [Paenisporosarcina antarctica]QBP41143.1 hypothetical protein E2636_08375 [Paenisporosarcina antarctica]